MKTVVQKYGGSSVTTVEHIKDVAEKVTLTRESGLDLVVVVSAMGEATDQLLSLTDEISSERAPRETDQLLATGEQRSAALLAMALCDRDVSAVSLTGSQAGLRTEGRHGSGVISEVRPEKARELLDEGEVVVVAGFQGMSSSGDVVTLGRGGSDTTAVALAAALDAERCEIYTDVEGVFTADPRIVPTAQLVPVVPLAEMAEIAWSGAKIVHSRAIELGMIHGVEIHVGSSLKGKIGTTIVRGEELRKPETREAITSIVHDAEVARITLNGVRTRPEMASKIFAPLSERGLSAEVSIESAPEIGTSDVAFTVARGDFEETRELAWKVASSLGGTVEGEKNLGKVSVVGVGMLNRPGCVAKALAALEKAGIPTRSVWTSELRVTCVIPSERVEDGVKLLHQTFELSGEG